MKKLAAVLFLLVAATTLYAQRADAEYKIDVQRVNTEHEIKITAVLYVGSHHYKVRTVCASYDSNFPCIIPHLGEDTAQYKERGAQKFLRLLTEDGIYGQQTMAEIVDIEENGQ